MFAVVYFNPGCQTPCRLMLSGRDRPKNCVRLTLLVRRSLHALAWLLVVASAVGQSALDGFDPDVDGLVNAVAIQVDGRILIGGRFTRVGGIVRSNLAR